MKLRPIIAISILLSPVFAFAQTPGKNRKEFTPRVKSKPNEVSVVLGPETPTTASQPLTTTTKPTTTQDSTQPPEPAAQDLVTIAPDQKKQPLENSRVQGVELLHAGSEPVDPAKVKLMATYPPKPLAAAPTGWHLAISENAPIFTREVELSRGVKVPLTIRPHVLIPDSDGANVFSIPEPGYQHSLGDRQTTTVGAILATSIRQLDEDCIQLGSTIENLQQLLISLPHPEVQPATSATPARKK
jgi:hypothetical protein